MKISFASEDGKGLDSMLAHHFGRCPYYIFVEVDGKKTGRQMSLSRAAWVRRP